MAFVWDIEKQIVFNTGFAKEEAQKIAKIAFRIKEDYFRDLIEFTKSNAVFSAPYNEFPNGLLDKVYTFDCMDKPLPENILNRAKRLCSEIDLRLHSIDDPFYKYTHTEVEEGKGWYQIVTKLDQSAYGRYAYKQIIPIVNSEEFKANYNGSPQLLIRKVEEFALENVALREPIQEMHFSKKDLQDPETINKILKRKDSFESVTKFIDYLIAALGVGLEILVMVSAGIISGVGAIFPIALICVLIISSVNSLPEKSFKKNMDKYKSKVIKLRDKALENMKKYPKNKDKYQEIVDNCNKVLKALDDREKEVQKAKLESEIEELKDEYNKLKKWYNHPYVLGHTGDGANEYGYINIFALAKEYDIDEQIFYKKAIEKLKQYDDWSIVFGEFFENKVNSKYKDSKFIMVSSDDESINIITLKDNKFYNCLDSMISSSFYKEAGKLSYSKEALIEFDKEMGFYKFSECPSQVKKKKFLDL